MDGGGGCSCLSFVIAGNVLSGYVRHIKGMLAGGRECIYVHL